MILVLGLLFVYLKMQERLIKSEKNILNMRFETMTEQYKELKNHMTNIDVYCMMKNI